MKKKFLLVLTTIFLTCAVLTCFFACTPMANYSKGLDFELNEEKTGYIITGVGTCNDRKIIIPSIHNGKTVVAICENAFSNDSFITAVEIPDSVTSIGDMAFYNCEKLTSVSIAKYATDINVNTFQNCPIKKATIPTTAMPYIPKENLKEIVITSATIDDYFFKNYPALTNITISRDTKNIGTYSFYNCNKKIKLKYEGTMKQWETLSKRFVCEDTEMCKIKEIECSDGYAKITFSSQWTPFL